MGDMQKWTRRLRAAIGVGLTWAAAWFGAGMILLLIVGPDAADVPFPLFFGFLGFLAGAVRLIAGPDGSFVVLGPIFAAAGAISASGTLALARRATAGELPAAD